MRSIPSSLAACDLLPPAADSARRICSSSEAGSRSEKLGAAGAAAVTSAGSSRQVM
uniref:Uncharacterized protein n=1 Tax=Siphoviridae sp. ctBLh2 TaxID=2827803 RepID=A0A8S5S455_9CAUD|nr:MAG TPA: hypothetical protein [Siphoviridae sp. ctBLh2]